MILYSSYTVLYVCCKLYAVTIYYGMRLVVGDRITLSSFAAIKRRLRQINGDAMEPDSLQLLRVF